MGHYLFSRIPALLFEPVAVIAVLSLPAALLIYRRRRGPFYLLLPAVILFMLGWRLICPLAFESRRYFDVLLYPALIAAAWGIFQLRDWLKRRNCLTPRRRRLVPCLVLAALLLVSLGKILRPRPYDDSVVKICRQLRQETAAGGKFRLRVAREHDRVRYYSGLPYQQVALWDGTPTTLTVLLEEYQNDFAPVYFIFFLRPGEPPEPELLKKHPAAGKWECLLREYTSRRKNREIVLCRFTPGRPGAPLWSGELPPMPELNRCPNGDFESLLAGQQLTDRLNYYRQIGAAEFYTAPERRFPAHWWPGVGAPVNGKSVLTALHGTRPLAGKYSLELNGNDAGDAGVNSGFFSAEAGVFSGFARALTESACRIYACVRLEREQKTVYVGSVHFTLDAGQTCRFTLPVRPENLPPAADKIYLVVQTPGHILLDNVAFLPAAGK